MVGKLYKFLFLSVERIPPKNFVVDYRCDTIFSRSSNFFTLFCDSGTGILDFETLNIYRLNCYYWKGKKTVCALFNTIKEEILKNEKDGYWKSRVGVRRGK